MAVVPVDQNPVGASDRHPPTHVHFQKPAFSHGFRFYSLLPTNGKKPAVAGLFVFLLQKSEPAIYFAGLDS
jgi:hypothetical protein